MGRCRRKDGNIISKVKVFKVREDSPLYSTRVQGSCLTDHPVDSSKEENRRADVTAEDLARIDIFCNFHVYQSVK